MFELQKIIVESVQSHLDLERFATYIIDKIVEKVQKNYKQNKEFIDIHDGGKYKVSDFFDLICIRYDELKHSKKYSIEFQDTLKKSDYLCIQISNPNKITLGEFVGDRKTIYIYLPSDSDLLLAVEKNDALHWRLLVNTRRSTLIHELQHWYDAIRSTKFAAMRDHNNNIVKDSKGNMVKDTKARYNLTPTAKEYRKKYGHLEPGASEESYNQYLKQHHEIIARFAQVASNLRLQRVKSVHDAIQYLKDEFVGWRKMPLKVQQKLMKKMATLYYYYYPKDTPKIDIQELINKYIESRKQTGYENLSIYTMGDILELQGVDGGKELTIIQDLIRIADIYRKNIVVHEDLLKKIPKETIRQLGFQKNKGKKYDFRFNYDEYYRYPKRSEQISKKN